MPYTIPDKLNTYFKNHLHLIAELQWGDDADDTGLKFGIFFTTRNPQKEGDPLFEGTAFVKENPTITKPSWNIPHTLFLLPLSQEAEDSLKKKEIKFNRLRLTNSQTIGGQYKYVYFNASEPDDVYLELDEAQQIGINKGHLYLLDSEGRDEPFPVVIIDEDFESSDRLFYFDAPGCLMHNEYNTKFQFWFGVRNSSQPYFRMGADDEIDSPVVWQSNKRLDDFVDGGKEFNWKLSYTIFEKGLSNRLGEAVNSWNTKYGNQAWLFLTENDNKRSIFPIYSCFKNDFSIDFILDTADLHFVQIAGYYKGEIYTRIGNWSRDRTLKQLNLLDKANDLLNRVKSSRKVVNKSLPFSIAPSIGTKNATDEPYVVCSDYNYETDRYGSAGYNLLKTYLVDVDLKLLKKPFYDELVTFPNVRDVNGEELNAQLTFNSSSNTECVNDNGTLFRIEIKQVVYEGKGITYMPSVSIGSLQFELRGLKEKGDFGAIYFNLTRKSTQKPFFLWQYNESIANDIELNYAIRNFRLPVKDIKPFGQDLLRKDKYLAPGTANAVGQGMGERVQYPLIIPLTENSKDAKTDEKIKYILQISESINIAQDFRVDMQILKYNPETNTDGQDHSSRVKAVILDHNPQFTGLIDTQFIQNKGENDNEWLVAQKSDLNNEDGAWEIANDAVADKGFKLILPSQSIGEAYVKHDELGKEKKDKQENKDEKIEYVEIGEPQKGKKIEYRLSPPAVLTIAQDRFNKRFVAPAWNLKRIWGRTGDQAPGVPLLNAQFESLYGLVSILDTDNKTYIAELGSKLGEAPPPALNSIQWKATEGQKEAFSKAYNYYLAFYRAWLSRLGILEPSGSDAFGKTEFSKELTVQPRFSIVESAHFIIKEGKIEKSENSSVDEKNIIYAKETTDNSVNTQLIIINNAIYYRRESNRFEVLNGTISLKSEEIQDDELLKESDLIYAYKADKKIIKLDIGLDNKVIEFEPYESNDLIITDGEIICPGDSGRLTTTSIYAGYSKEGTVVLLRKSEKNVLEIIGPDIKYPIRSIEKQDDLLAQIKRLHNADGLAGGAFYGFEAEVIYKEFWKAFLEGKKSTSAEIKNIAFSSLGMWAKQTARFAQDKTIIKNTTTMGRTHFYAVERIGRIGVFWNKAKHVIEYERTVVTSKQFPGQPDHNGRVLVRKVREYIEILEPSRSYPDYEGNIMEASGCVKAMTFKSKIIPVLGSWGKTVKKYHLGTNEWDGIGWEVPLWNKEADPEVYPKPQVLVEALAGSDFHTQTVSVTISEPENLYFYTDCREKVNYRGVDVVIDANTNVWPAVLYTDYTLLPLPKQFDISPSASVKGEGLNAPLAAPLDVYPGFERFTFRVESSQSPVSVTGAYYPDSIFTGKLRTVTMMRLNTKNNDLKNEEVLKKSGYTDLFGEKGKPGILQKTANGFVDIENRLRSYQAISIDDYKKHIRSGYIDSIKPLEPKNNIPLQYLKGIEDRIREIKKANDAEIQSIQSRIVEIEKEFDWVNNQELKKEHESLLNKKNVLTVENDQIDFWLKDPSVSEKIDNSNFNFLVQPVWLKILEGADGLLFRAHSFLDEQFAQLKKEIDQFTSDNEKNIERFKTEVERVQKELNSFRLNLDLGLERVRNVFNENIIEKVKTFLDNKKMFEGLLDNLDGEVENAFAELDKIDEIIDRIKAGLQTIDDLKTKIKDAKGIDQKIKDKILAAIDKIRTYFLDFIAEIEGFNHDTLENFTQKTKDSYKDFRDNIDEGLQAFYAELQTSIEEVEKDIKKLTEEFKEQTDEAWDTAWALINNEIKKLEGFYDLKKSEFDVKFEETRNQADAILINQLLIRFFLPVLFGRKEDEVCVYSILVSVNSWINNIMDSIKQSLLELIKGGNFDPVIVNEWLGKYQKFKDLEEALKKGDPDKIISASIALANELNTELGEVAGHIAEIVQKSDAVAKSWESMKDVADTTLNNYRAVFEKFTAPGMGFNRETISMIVNTDWKDIEEKLSLTPVMGKVQEFEDRLNAVGINLPIAAIADSLLPAKETWDNFSNSMLKKFDFSNIINKLSADFTNMIPGFKFMDEFRDKIKVTQGFDRKELRGWVKAKADIAFNDRKKLFSLGSLIVELDKGRFFANMDADIDPFGTTTTKSTGALAGSWIVHISGQELITFENAVVKMNDGKFNFDLDPQNIKMSGLLKILTDATKEMSKTGAVPPAKDAKGKKTDYFKVSIQKLKYKYEGGKEIEIPTGIKAAVNIPNITVGGGTTSLSNLSFGAFFLLSLIDQGEEIVGSKFPKINFKIGTGFYLSSREAPFNLAFFIFGGGGYFKCNFLYEPSKPNNGNGLTMDFAMSIHASACFAFNAGWMSGSLIIAMGLEGEFVKKPKEADISRVAMFVMLSGNADIMGMVTVSLYVRLEATYTKSAIGTQIQGKGMIRVKIEVCRFVTITVRREFTKVFSGPGEDSSNSSEEIDYDTDEILNSLA
ncbi:hypothetical protein ACM46_11170 [Chryseobacterium angstadtii]|uniref:Uncharacterized protein n=1 Tax=Chryseobacterium angstadtii TaxID=558151 RepID=A0A0J7IEA9_9FLAO|nr:hypothetical protein [Chryseobacterium angstadtii]KMQ64783.1 hypothetical protein ACM46_11170 [Chryseobacterium angstadtii]